MQEFRRRFSTPIGVYPNMWNELFRARLAIQNGNLAVAETGLRAVIAAATDAPLRAAALWDLGNLATEQRRFDVAGPCFEVARQLAPNEPALLNNLALVYNEAGNHRAAATVARQLGALAPESDQVWVQLGRATRSSRHLRRAIGLGGSEAALAVKFLSDVLMPGPNYLDILEKLHQVLKPKIYLEIGVWHGASLALAANADCAVGIDPNPQISQPLSANANIVRMTSDEFFAQDACSSTLNGRAIDFGFIDGLHEHDQVLRDFAHVEQFCRQGSVVALHDCYPPAEICADPNYDQIINPGDCWRAAFALHRLCPDLTMALVPAPPTGLLLVGNLNPARSWSSGTLSKALAIAGAVKFVDAFPRDKPIWPMIENSPQAVGDWLRLVGTTPDG